MATSRKTYAPAQLPGAFSLLMPSWEAVKLNIITFLELIGIPLLIDLLGSLIEHGSPNFLGTSIRVAGLIVAIVFAPALILVQLKSARRQTIDFAEALQAGLAYLWRYIGLAICMTVVIGIGFLLLVIPGLFMLRRYYLAPYYLIDRDLKVFEAMEASARDSRRFSGAVWGLIGVTLLFALLSIIIVGIIFAVMYYCAPALRYLEIKQPAKRKVAARA